MTGEVSVEAKKEFIRWLLKRYEMKRREVVWLLNYMLTNDELLKNTHFVEEARHCPKALVFSTTNVGDIPFRFYHSKIMTADAEMAFLEIRRKTADDLYIQANFRSETVSMPYLNVLEENEYQPKYSNDKDIEKEANFIIEESLRKFQENLRTEQIDYALDTKDEKAFLALTSKMSGE